MQPFRSENPLIVQGDQTILVEVASPRYADARDALIRFAELMKAPEHVHTYRISPLSIWNACAAGVPVEQMAETLTEYAKYPVPPHVLHEIRDYAARYGRVKLFRDERGLVLSASDLPIAEEIARNRHSSHLLRARLTDTEFEIGPQVRGDLKQALIKIGYPAEDLAGYVEGEALQFAVRPTTRAEVPFAMREYQVEAACAFHAGGSARGGSGVIVLPCGAGKTIVGIGCMAQLQCSTLILTTSTTAIRQWIEELLDKTTLQADDIAEYSGATKQIRPVTIATYQIMTARDRKDAEFRHMGLFDERNWGLIIYDEVHLLPAPVFRATASLQARRRLGLTATLVREDGREDDVFALIGPKKADVPWKVLENQGWIATASCTEVRVPLPDDMRLEYAIADPRDKHRIAAENPLKNTVVRDILDKHPEEQVLIIGMYLNQLKQVAGGQGLHLLTGATPQWERDEVYADFKAGRIRVLACSKIANFAVDLPDASVAIQISGTFGSRQEEAQRLGRILRPKSGTNQAHFYTVVTRDTVEQDFALRRQLFLCEQGYGYTIVDADEEPVPA
jgi:DNA excision repair protein ERCC-3